MQGARLRRQPPKFAASLHGALPRPEMLAGTVAVDYMLGTFRCRDSGPISKVRMAENRPNSQCGIYRKALLP